VTDRDTQYVELALAAAGIEPSPEDLAVLVSEYPTLRAMADSLRQVAEAREEPPEPPVERTS
jgi:hypothetical protein